MLINKGTLQSVEKLYRKDKHYTVSMNFLKTSHWFTNFNNIFINMLMVGKLDV